MRHTLFTVDQPCPGRLSTMAKPRGGDWLVDEMKALRAAGVYILVCALTTDELSEANLTQEPQAARDAGLEFVPIPIIDRHTPDSAIVLPDIRRFAERLRAGGHIVTHCRFGIGRASLLAAGVLVLNGLPPDQVWERLERARGHAVPIRQHSVNGRTTYSTAPIPQDDAVDVAGTTRGTCSVEATRFLALGRMPGQEVSSLGSGGHFTREASRSVLARPVRPRREAATVVTRRQSGPWTSDRAGHVG